MKEIAKTILQFIHARNIQSTAFYREFPKFKELGFEKNGTTPLEKAAFALHYLCCDEDKNPSTLAPIVEGTLYYLKNNNYKCNTESVEEMYTALKSAFDNNDTAEHIKGILTKYTYKSVGY